ncbi:MAG: hypothetical protein ACTS42_01775, partial [Candidatus Hodgkinia cicadicola]
PGGENVIIGGRSLWSCYLPRQSAVRNTRKLSKDLPIITTAVRVIESALTSALNRDKLVKR